jgi:hypothetical protein
MGQRPPKPTTKKQPSAPLSISVTTNQQPSIPITNQQIFLHILAFPGELFTLIASFIDAESQIALAHTCKTIYDYHKGQCREEKAAFLCLNSKEQYCKVLERWLSKTGWAAVKVIFEKIETNSQNNNSHPIRALYLDQSHQFPDELKCENINALILDSSLGKLATLAGFCLENFSNLKALKLSHTLINESIVSVLSKLPLLKIVSLFECTATDDHLSVLFETCTTLEEIELVDSDYATITMFPPQLKRLCVEGHGQPISMRLWRCTQLQSL